MASTKPGRPLVYEAEGERPVTVSLRVPRDLHEQVQRYVRMRPPMTMTEFLLEAARLKLETPTDPRDIVLSDDNTVIQELQTMVEAAVEAALARRDGQKAVTSHAPAQAYPQEPTANLSHDYNTVLQPEQADFPETEPELSYDDNTIIRQQQYEAELGHSIVTEPTRETRGGARSGGGRKRSALGQQILDLLASHPEGLTAEQMRGHLSPGKPLGDILAGMRRTGTVSTEGEGRAIRYFAKQA